MAYLQCRRESKQLAAAPWRRFIHGLYQALLQRVPTDCPLCGGGASGGRLCTGCLSDVTESMNRPRARCKVCALALNGLGACRDCAARPAAFDYAIGALRPFAFDRVIAAFDYAPPGDLLVQHFKVGRRFGHARMLAEIMAAAVNAATPALPGNTILVPVPASRASIRQRGFNPAAELARCLAQQLQLAYRPGLLLRRHEGVKQTRLTRAGRAQSAPELYACPQRVEKASIAIVDDVLTTGSTLHSISQEFKAAGAATVCGLVLARTPYR